MLSAQDSPVRDMSREGLRPAEPRRTDLWVMGGRPSRPGGSRQWSAFPMGAWDEIDGKRVARQKAQRALTTGDPPAHL